MRKRYLYIWRWLNPLNVAHQGVGIETGARHNWNSQQIRLAFQIPLDVLEPKGNRYARRATSATHEHLRGTCGSDDLAAIGLPHPVSFGDMFHGVGQHGGELGLVLRRQEQGCGYEHVPAWQGGGFVHDWAGILGNHSECEVSVSVRKVHCELLAEAVDIRLYGVTLNRRSPTAQFGSQLLAQCGFFFAAIEIDALPPSRLVLCQQRQAGEN